MKYDRDGEESGMMLRRGWQDGAGTKYKLSDIMIQAFRKEHLSH